MKHRVTGAFFWILLASLLANAYLLGKGCA